MILRHHKGRSASSDHHRARPLCGRVRSACSVLTPFINRLYNVIIPPLHRVSIDRGLRFMPGENFEHAQSCSKYSPGMNRRQNQKTGHHRPTVYYLRVSSVSRRSYQLVSHGRERWETVSHPAKKTILFFLSESVEAGGQAVITRTKGKRGLYMRTVSPVPGWLGPGIDPV